MDWVKAEDGVCVHVQTLDGEGVPFDEPETRGRLVAIRPWERPGEVSDLTGYPTTGPTHGIDWLVAWPYARNGSVDYEIVTEDDRNHVGRTTKTDPTRTIYTLYERHNHAHEDAR